MNMKNQNNDERGRVVILKDGPYLVTGRLPLEENIIAVDKNGDAITWAKGIPYPTRDKYSLCRCGQSRSKPFCDGSHTTVRFDGTETAAKGKYLEQAGQITGPGLVLTDAEPLCAVARFCDPAGGVWQLTEQSDDPEAKAMAVREACLCPSGRLVIWNRRTGKAIEPTFKRSVGLVQDPYKKVSGPIWIKGRVPVISSDGTRYEIRNRVTLCRCGASENKPFCDGSHISIGFSDSKKN